MSALSCWKLMRPGLRQNRRDAAQRTRPRAWSSGTEGVSFGIDDFELLRMGMEVEPADLIRVGSGVNGRGLFYQRDVWRESVLTVPLKSTLLITDKPGLGPSIFGEDHLRRWQELHFPLPPLLRDFVQSSEPWWYVRLGAWLLFVRKEAEAGRAGPFWTSYIKTLPRVHTSLMNFETDEERAALQDRALAEDALADRKAALQAHRELLGPGGSLGPLGLSRSEDETLWALSCIRSRTFSEKVYDESISLVIPFVDICNHSSAEPNCLFSVADDGSTFSFNSYRHRERDMEVFISYGDRSNADLMRDYGFVSQGNHADRLFSSREVSTIPALHEETFLDCLGINPQSLRLPGRLNASAWIRDFPGAVERGRIEGVARSLVAGSQQPGSAARPKRASGGFRWPWEPRETDASAFSLSAEREAINTLRTRIQRSYSSSTLLGSTSSAQDAAEAERLFKAGSPRDCRLAAAAMYRLERKMFLAEAERVLQRYAIYLDQGLSVF